jgi:hypothetical protein
MSRPARPRLNVRLSPDEILSEKEQFHEGDPMREMIGDGNGIDYRLPPPPWNKNTLEIMTDNLAILRIDPKHSNVMQMETCIVRTIAKTEENIEVTNSFLGDYMAELLSEWDAETVKKVFADILRMKENEQLPPHRNFLAYRAYCDFLLEFGFEPTRQKLAKFIVANHAKYPVGLGKTTTGKDWWEMFFEAGLARLEE